MKLIIDIDNEIYNEIKNKGQGKWHCREMDNAIRQGTPLPKGHGRLFILDEEKAKEFFTKFSFSSQDWISEVGISNATIKVIKADKEESK